MVNFGGTETGVVELQGASKARNFNINHAVANVTAAGLMEGNVNFNAAGRLTANGGITGNVYFNGHDGIINLADGQTIDGSITTQGGW